MSYVMAAPEMIAAAATDVAAVGSTLSAAHLAAAAPTVGVIPAAADEVSASIAHFFSQHAQGYQALAGKAAAFHEEFVQHLSASAHSFAAAEAANAASLLHLHTSAVSSASAAAAALPAPLLNLLTSIGAAVTQLINKLETMFNTLNQFLMFLVNTFVLMEYLKNIIHYVKYLVASLRYYLVNALAQVLLHKLSLGPIYLP